MNRLEALRALGLDEDATDEDIKTAYRETAQILHPDRFATNKSCKTGQPSSLRTCKRPTIF